MNDICTRCGRPVELEEAHAHGLDYFHPECCSQCHHPSTWGTREVSDRGVIAVACLVVLVLALLMAPTLARGPQPVAERIQAEQVGP